MAIHKCTTCGKKFPSSWRFDDHSCVTDAISLPESVLKDLADGKITIEEANARAKKEGK